MLELIEEPLDEIALAINRVVDGATNQPAAEARNVGSCPGLADEVENGVAVIAAVCDDVAPRRQVPQKLGHDALVVCLPRGQNDADRQAIVGHDRVDLGTQSSTRTTDGVILAPFLPPAACWCARMIELSMSWSEVVSRRVV